MAHGPAATRFVRPWCCQVEASRASWSGMVELRPLCVPRPSERDVLVAIVVPGRLGLGRASELGGERDADCE